MDSMVYLVSVPGHNEVKGHIVADRLAKGSVSHPQSGVCIDMVSAKNQQRQFNFGDQS